MSNPSLIEAYFKYTVDCKYAYRFNWLGVPIIQYPQDLMLIQDLIWQTKPDMIIETGIAHGGSLMFYASLMHLICPHGLVLGVDCDIREHTKRNLMNFKQSTMLRTILGNSINFDVFNQVLEYANAYNKIMVILDSDHTKAHVEQELLLYGSLVSPGCYLIVCDTCIEFLPRGHFKDRPWDVGNNPWNAVKEFLLHNTNFVDSLAEVPLQISTNPGGYLQRIK